MGTMKGLRMPPPMKLSPVLSMVTEEDVLKAKESEFLDFERKFLVVVGAAYVAREQLSSVVSTSRCSLCRQKCVDKHCIDRLKTTAQEYQKVIRQFVSEKKQLQLDVNPKKRCREWLTFEMKKGRVKTIRQQKQASVIGQQCVACGNKIQRMSRFLKGVDQLARSMESELHNHNSSRSPALDL